MTVIVHDRHGKEWKYSTGVGVKESEGNITIYDEKSRSVGGFNTAAWASYSVDKPSEAAERITVNEPLTYTKDSRFSYIKDLVQHGLNDIDEPGRERLRRHAIDVATNADIRAITGVCEESIHIPPLWLLEKHEQRLSKGLLGGITARSMPQGVSMVHAHQSSDSFSSAPVIPLSGLQGLDLGKVFSFVGLDECIIPDLSHGMSHQLVRQILYGSGEEGQLRGIQASHQLSGDLTSFDTLRAAVREGLVDLYSQGGAHPDWTLVLHPRQWAMIRATTGDDGESFEGLPTMVEPLVDNSAWIMPMKDLVLFRSPPRVRIRDGREEENPKAYVEMYHHVAFTADRASQNVLRIASA